MYFGGYPGKHHYDSVTNMDFDGCIDHVNVDSTAVDLSKHVIAFGVLPACPVQVTARDLDTLIRSHSLGYL